MDEATITVDAQPVAYTCSEGGGRAVVFVHGNSSSSQTWRPLLAGPFGQRHRCLALDLVGEGRFADEVAIVAELGRPLAVLQGDQEQLISLDYLTKLTIPSLWRGAVQIVPGTGHAPHLEAPEEFTSLLEQFVADVG